MKRQDDFNKRREHLKNLSDEELKNRFWQLAEKIVEPMLELAHKNTSPSIERSVLLRMGFSSIEAKTIVEGVMDRGLMSKGAGHVVYKLALNKDIPVRDAGLKLLKGECWDEVQTLFEGGTK
ncbi:MAG: ornithine aminomutase subunit alpha [Anaeromicrobium sp.]|uniref:ornithine aminomutase subunit alpha n=1 Tax=Anaeromicrobium sp. TaxID=1929132 RepID=UPI0025D96781|nr:ornithine aminomutase subunit alpha [Anaeromicrobium sp.]MCT4595140.1 ornithine aminomutase subunit alpha [Anaeromicrobium sp.]